MCFRKLRREGNTHVIQYISLTFKALNAYSQRERGNKQRNTICSLTPREYLCSQCFYFPKGSGPVECVRLFVFFCLVIASTTLTRHFRVGTPVTMHTVPKRAVCFKIHLHINVYAFCFRRKPRPKQSFG